MSSGAIRYLATKVPISTLSPPPGYTPGCQDTAVSPHDACGPQQGDLRLSGPPSDQGAGDGAGTRDRMVPADLRADSLATVPPTHLCYFGMLFVQFKEVEHEQYKEVAHH
ncbi:hypothetical protein PoB_001718800 [Plakobranchus ocellatus]|uniref:Uncharacterized protein n=1 Tax=Plakobranchus ocellatus TaxID=259542 RepID=A0AAV3Z8A5_9GAST|nr:hypothetical protein PoB_001718800 [Plakobranchus ocellatus]